MGVEQRIRNSHLITEFFGYWPEFISAEVLQVVLDHDNADAQFGPHLRAIIDTSRPNFTSGYGSPLLPENQILVSLIFLEVAELSITEFEQQNILRGLYIKDISHYQLDRIKFEVYFESEVGLEAEFKCFAITVESVETYALKDAHNG